MSHLVDVSSVSETSQSYSMPVVLTGGAVPPNFFFNNLYAFWLPVVLGLFCGIVFAICIIQMPRCQKRGKIILCGLMLMTLILTVVAAILILQHT